MRRSAVLRGPGRAVPVAALTALLLLVVALARHKAVADRVTPTSPLTCPAGQVAGGGHPHPGMRERVVPGHPLAVVTCTYTVLRPHLTGSRVVRGPAVARLAAYADTGERSLLHGTISCPDDDGKRFVMRFRYARGGDLTVLVAPRGCSGLFTGGRWWFLGPHFPGVLAALLPVHA